jgi:hypothetical protein
MFTYSSDTLDIRYKNAYDYLATSKDVRVKLNDTYNITNSESIWPIISDSIIFFDYSPFCLPTSKECQLQLSSEEKDIYKFTDLHYFPAYKNSLLKTIEKSAASKFRIYFSKPVDNFLTSEIYLINDQAPFSNGYRGRYLKLIFIFNSDNTISNFLMSPLYIN